jgi:hypothetical protein
MPSNRSHHEGEPIGSPPRRPRVARRQSANDAVLCTDDNGLSIFVVQRRSAGAQPGLSMHV